MLGRTYGLTEEQMESIQVVQKDGITTMQYTPDANLKKEDRGGQGFVY
jgi:hypothetical protein